MGKRYQDLSRRALIKFNEDFDASNNAALLDYLTENGDNYEDIRMVEKLIDRFDGVKEALTNSKQGVRKAISAETDRVMNAVINVLETAIDTAESVIEN